MRLVAAFGLALGAALLLTPLVRRLAGALGLYAQPSGDRWHQRPVALLGGLPILAAVLIGAVATAPVGPLLPLLAGGLLMGLVGMADDLMSIRPATKLVLQLIIVTVIVYWLPQIRLTASPIVDVLLAILWMVGITNALNLLDNIDGLAAGIAAIAAAFYLAVLLPGGPTPLNCALAAFVGASIGFLFYNFHPASIFMGDTGSLFLGAFLGTVGLIVSPQVNAQLAWLAAIPVLILLIPIFDVVFVTLMRRLAGRSALRGGRDHTSHRLVALGIGERRAVLFLYVLAILGGAVGLSLQYVGFGYAVILIDMYVVLLVGLGVFLGHVEESVPGTGSIELDRTRSAPLLSEVTNRYRLYEVLLDQGLIAVAYYAAFRIRFDATTLSAFFVPFAASFPLVIVTQLAGLWLAGKYRHVWRSFGAAEVVTILKGVMLGVLGSVWVAVYLYRFERFSRGVFVIDAIVLTFLLIGSRVAIASIDQYLSRQRAGRRDVLIYGAGRGGALLVHKLLQDKRPGGMPVGFVDDDSSKRWMTLEGLPVMGSCIDLPEILRSRPISQLIISIEDLPDDRLLRVEQICRERGVPLKRARFTIEDVNELETAYDAVRYGR
jgi:UDP-GlcNAc:undecaprenyl-phosphate GlcNAc-1-phosphate transferase